VESTQKLARFLSENKDFFSFLKHFDLISGENVDQTAAEINL